MNKSRFKSFTNTQITAGVFAVIFVCHSLLQLSSTTENVDITHTQINNTPVTVYRPDHSGSISALPVVVISHGFAGSQQLMQSFAMTFARNDYIAVTFDYLGHGRNPTPLGGDVTDIEGSTKLLLKQTQDIVDYAVSLSSTDAGLALLGHSMASDLVVRYAQIDTRVDGTIAVSLFSPAVSKEQPYNFLIIVGEYEKMLKKEALRVLSLVTPEPAVNTTYGDFDAGSARRVTIADNVEHIGVLYSADSMRESLAWLNQLFNKQTSGYLDSRGISIVLLLLGIVILAWPLSTLLPTVSLSAAGASLEWRQLIPLAVIPSIATPLLLWKFPADFLSLLVGGYLAVHFAVYGVITAACLYWLYRRKLKLSVTASGSNTNLLKALIATLASTLYVAGIIALAIDTYFTSFAITAQRLPLIFTMLLGTLCYFLADEWLARGEKAPAAALAFTRTCFLLSLGLAVALSFKELFFLLIIAVVIALYFLVYGLFSSWIYKATGHPAVSAIANAVAFAWALVAVFPILSG